MLLWIINCAVVPRTETFHQTLKRIPRPTQSAFNFRLFIHSLGLCVCVCEWIVCSATWPDAVMLCFKLHTASRTRVLLTKPADKTSNSLHTVLVHRNNQKKRSDYMPQCMLCAHKVLPTALIILLSLCLIHSAHRLSREATVRNIFLCKINTYSWNQRSFRPHTHTQTHTQYRTYMYTCAVRAFVCLLSAFSMDGSLERRVATHRIKTSRTITKDRYRDVYTVKCSVQTANLFLWAARSLYTAHNIHRTRTTEIAQASTSIEYNLTANGLVARTPKTFPSHMRAYILYTILDMLHIVVEALLAAGIALLCEA